MRRSTVQYGKKAAARRSSMATPTPELSSRESTSSGPTDMDMDDEDDDYRDVISDRKPSPRKKPVSMTKAKASPRTGRSSTNTTTPVDKGKGKATEVVARKRSPFASRRLDKTVTLAATLKRKVTLDDISSGVESDDTLRLTAKVETPRKRPKLNDNESPPSSKKSSPVRKPYSGTPYVEIVTPKDLSAYHQSPSKHSASTSGTSHASANARTSTVPSTPTKPLKKHNFEILLPSPRYSAGKKAKQAPPPATTLGGSPTKKFPADIAESTPTKSASTSKAAKYSSKPSNSSLEKRKVVDSPKTSTSPSPAPMALSPKKPAPGVARRMLARTRTEPTLEETHPDISPSKSSAMTPSPSSPVKSVGLDQSPRPSFLQSQSQMESQPRDDSPPPTRPTARTYAKSRSFLVELTDNLLQGNEESQGSQNQESYQDLRLKWGMDEFENGADGNSGLPNDLRTVTEMRSKGESRRFMDELGYLFEGLDAKEPLSIRRSSAVELIGKMRDPDFVRKAKVADIIDRAWEMIDAAGASSGDIVVQTAWLAFAAFISRDARDLNDLAQKDGFESLMIAILAFTRRKDPLIVASSDEITTEEAKKAGLGKPERRLVKSIHESLAEAEFFQRSDSSSPCLSSRLLASQILKTLKPQNLSTALFGAVTSSLLAELRLVSSRVEAYAKGLNLRPPSEIDDASLYHIEHCFEILQLAMLGSDKEEVRGAIDGQAQDLAEGFVALAVYCEAELVQRSNDSPVALKCFIDVLQFLISSCETKDWATNTAASPLSIPLILRTALVTLPMSLATLPSTNLPSSDGVMEIDTQDHGAKSGLDAELLQFDLKCYALALLTTLLQKDDRCADVVGSAELSMSCQRSRSCLKACHCVGKPKALSGLIKFYTELGNEEANPSTDFLRGHLAVMLALLVLRPSNRDTVLSEAPGPSPRARLDDLLAVINEFLALHAQVTRTMSSLLQQGDPPAGDSGEHDEEAADGCEHFKVSNATLASSLHSGEDDSEVILTLVKKLHDIRKELPVADQ